MPQTRRSNTRSRTPLSEEESRDYVMKRTDWMDDKKLLDPEFDEDTPNK
mgnify:CR=1 FL=1